MVFRITFIIGLIMPMILFSRSTAESKAEYIMDSVDSLVKARLELLDKSLLDHRYDKVVKRRIMSYVERWPRTTGRLISRSARYLPVFEEQLLSQGMPTSLKYVTIQESALRPWATSHAGAAGFWQLMPGTARELGLIVDDVLDERLDVELGCKAGLDYLKIQYEKYDDWALALAAYNCGPGNVNKAIRRSGGKRDYWKIRKHLPRETQRYIPNIIAATYLVAFYHEHDVEVSEMELDLQITEAITIQRKLSLYKVSQITRLRPEIVIELNPQYLKGYLPGLPEGHRLRLPKRVMPAMRHYLNKYPATIKEIEAILPWSTPQLSKGELDANRYYTQYIITAGSADTTMRQLAESYSLPVDQLVIWSNRGEKDSLTVGENLIMYRVSNYLKYDPRDRNTPPAVSEVADKPLAPVTIPDRHLKEHIFRSVPQPKPIREKRKSFAQKLLDWLNE